MVNTGSTYYFINDFNQICKQNKGVDKDFSEVLDLQELIDDTNNLAEENEQLKNENAKMKKELSLLAEFNQKAIL